jgi:hypothetical protein
VQIVLHIPLVLQANGAHVLGAPGWQVPLPSHLGGKVRVIMLHMELPQVVPEGVKRQVPLPPQLPSLPHMVPSDAHSPAGSVPFKMLPQVPSLG